MKIKINNPNLQALLVLSQFLCVQSGTSSTVRDNTHLKLEFNQLGCLEEERKKEFEGSIARMPRADGLAYLETLKSKVSNSEQR